MALTIANYFHVLADEELTDESLANGATTALPDAKKKMEQQKKQANRKKKQQTMPDAATTRAKPIVGQNRLMLREQEIRRPKQNLNFGAAQNQDAVVERETLTLKEYEKEALGSKKSLNPIIKKPDDREVEKVTVDKDFEFLEVPFIKPKSYKLKAGDAKAYMLANSSGFLKPLRRETSFAAANGRGKFSGRFSGKESAATAEHGGRIKSDPTLNIEDRIQFPALK